MWVPYFAPACMTMLVLDHAHYFSKGVLRNFFGHKNSDEDHGNAQCEKYIK